MDDIRPPNETFDNIGRVRRLQIERERPLSSLRAEKGPLHAAHHVTPGSLDLDDVGTQIAQNHRCQRTCDERTEVDNMNALERETSGRTLAEWRGHVIPDRNPYLPTGRCSTLQANQ